MTLKDLEVVGGLVAGAGFGREELVRQKAEVVADCDQAKRLNKNTESIEAATLRAERIRSSLILALTQLLLFVSRDCNVEGLRRG